MAELADSVKNSRSRITHTIARMERAGLVERASARPTAAASSRILTDAGVAQARRRGADPRRRRCAQALIDVVDDDDLEAVGRAFGAVADTLETGEPDPISRPGCRG